MRLVALLAVFLGGMFWVNATPVPLPVNCGVGPTTSQRTVSGELVDQTGPGPRTMGHAHNDYEHDRPLLDAVAAGLTSVEADVWAVEGRLLVAHTRDEVDRSRTLASLYLDPLARRLTGKQSRGGKPALQLVIDVKSDPATTLPLLRAELADHASVLTSYRGCTTTPGAVDVVLSGNVRPSAPSAEAVSYFGYDLQPDRTGRTPQGDAITPLVSAKWHTYFTWDGHGSMPADQREALQEMVRTAHAAGSAIRFYGTPDRAGPARDAVWSELVAAGVDYVSTDDLVGWQTFDRGLDEPRRARTS